MRKTFCLFVGYFSILLQTFSQGYTNNLGTRQQFISGLQYRFGL